MVKPLKERWDQEVGRVFLKQPGEGYLLRKTPSAEEEANIRAHATFLPPAEPDEPAAQDTEEVPAVVSKARLVRVSLWERVVLFFRTLTIWRILRGI